MHNNNKPSTPRFILLAALVWACLATAAPAANNGTAGSQPVFHFSTPPSGPVIEYTLVHHMLAQADPQPLLRIYGDGRVHVHIPAYMKRAGDYRLTMTPAELGELLRLLADDGIMDFDPVVAGQEKQQLEATRRKATGLLHAVSDATDTLINIRLQQYQRTAASPRVNNFSKQFSWRNLESDARRYPSAGRIMRAATAAATLHALCSHPALQKLP